MKRFVMTTISLAALLAGCDQATKIDVAENRRELTNVIERGHSELSAQHIRMMEDNIDALKAEVEKSKANAAEAINKANEASLKAIAEEQARLKDIQTVKEIVNIIVPEQAAKVVSIATKGIDTKIETLNALTQEIQGQVSIASSRMNTTENRLANVDSTVTEVNRNLMTVDASAKMASLIAERNQKDTTEVQDDLESRTKEGLLGLLAVLTGGGALAKTGRSREHKEISQLGTKVAALGEVIARQPTGGTRG